MFRTLAIIELDNAATNGNASGVTAMLRMPNGNAAQNERPTARQCSASRKMRRQRGTNNKGVRVMRAREGRARHGTGECGNRSGSHPDTGTTG